MTDLPPTAFPRGFASDNFAGVHPRVLEGLAAVNRGHARAYGDDPVTAALRAAFDRLLGQPVTTHLVFNGTAANCLALSAFARPYGAVICSDVAHLYNDERTAPERILGMRPLPVPSVFGKVDPASVEAVLRRGHGVHAVKPVALTLTQPTELGTVYSLEELRALCEMAHRHGLGVHVDGARLGCAAATLGASLREMLVETGVDAVSFGGTKQGLLCGEAVLYLRPGIGGEFPYWQKHAMQLASKMRFVSAQFEALLEGDLWLENARWHRSPASRWSSRCRPTRSSPASRRSGSHRSSGPPSSGPGTRRPGWSAGCAPGTPSQATWPASRPPWRRRATSLFVRADRRRPAPAPKRGACAAGSGQL